AELNPGKHTQALTRPAAGAPLRSALPRRAGAALPPALRAHRPVAALLPPLGRRSAARPHRDAVLERPLRPERGKERVRALGGDLHMRHVLLHPDGADIAPAEAARGA